MTEIVAIRCVPPKPDAKTLPGITEFPGFFDPLGLSEKATVDEIKRWREAEVTHGRVSMLAALGFIIGEQVSP